MKTIEERAKEYNKRYFSKNDDLFQLLAKVAYTTGATEQKAIDDEVIKKLNSIMEHSASVLGIGSKWFNENARLAAVAELKQEIINYLSENRYEKK